ncbi:MAG: GNAT family N-acetyltransferase [Firmicutes bacterium]|nr:GNAT family N-acetyltransferase [Bacillota bacterium]
MEIRPLTPHDMDQARTLWEVCFEDLPAFLDWYFQARFQPADGLGIFLKGRLVCDLHLSPRAVKLRRQNYPAAYLIALATAPSFRRLGLAKTLLTYALRHLAARGIYFTFLLPFNTKFYTRLGWGEWADHRLYHLSPAGHRTGKADPNPKGESSWRFRQVEAAQQLTLLADIYARFFAHVDGGLTRSAQDWTCLLLDHSLYGGKTWLATDRAGTPHGYALVLPPDNGRPILRELIALDPTLKDSFLPYLAAQLAGASCPPAVPEDGAAQLTPFIPPGTQPVFLGRITRVPPMLEAGAYPPLSVEWVLEVTDPLLPENNGQYRIKVAAGKMRVTKTTGEQPAVRCSVGTLARLITGNAHPEELVAHGDLTLDHPQFLTVLTALFPPATNFINEYF